jgi:DNA-directed RNA polymerase specialized sigma24 family protein
VLLGELDGIPQVVLADRLSATPGAIYKVSHDARKKLKAVLERAGYDATSVEEVLAA